VNAPDKWLKTFFEEKQVPYTSWTIRLDDEEHYIDSDCVIESIYAAPVHEKEKIIHMLRLLDYNNGCIENYLRFLAGAMIRQRRDCQNA